MEEFYNKGFCILDKLVPHALIDETLFKVKKSINMCAESINVKASRYLSCTGRWASPSIITDSIDQQIDSKLKEKVGDLICQNILVQKKNLVCKNRHIKEAVPYHQDISYSPDTPYHFSVWLALNDIDKNAGPLKFIEASHKWTISPAVDFWAPTAKLAIKSVRGSQERIITLKKGDGVIFDSRLWHGSIKSLKGSDRYAYVTRWKIVDAPFPFIPPIEPLYFGMWNCHEITSSVLCSMLRSFNINIENDGDFLEVLRLSKQLINLLSDSKSINMHKANKDLEDLIILHMAATNHNAGDLTGQIYKKLWYSLLCYLKL